MHFMCLTPNTDICFCKLLWTVSQTCERTMHACMCVQASNEAERLKGIEASHWLDGGVCVCRFQSCCCCRKKTVASLKQMSSLCSYRINEHSIYTSHKLVASVEQSLKLRSNLWLLLYQYIICLLKHVFLPQFIYLILWMFWLVTQAFRLEKTNINRSSSFLLI